MVGAEGGRASEAPLLLLAEGAAGMLVLRVPVGRARRTRRRRQGGKALRIEWRGALFAYVPGGKRWYWGK